jgi:hypothetical protein
MVINRQPIVINSFKEKYLIPILVSYSTNANGSGKCNDSKHTNFLKGKKVKPSVSIRDPVSI